MANLRHLPAMAACPDCALGPFTRNYYFDGKFLVARDFWDEQTFHVDKLRHHHQRLHGWGVVCGLEVTPHETPACRDRYVYIQPGTAIDCCGHEIVVREPELVDIWQFEAIEELRAHPDGKDHAVQICIRYRECPTEDVPVLYDDCGCDDTGCLPNRVLESFAVEVLLDPPPPTASFDQPRLAWRNTVGIAHAERVALHEGTQRLYVLTADTPSTLYQVSTGNHSLVAPPRNLPTRGLALLASDDGTR